MLPSPLQSLWAFLGYVVVIGTPLWKIITWLGDVNFVMDYAGPFLNALNTAPGTVSMMLVGFGLLAWANHKERLAPATQVEAATEPPPTTPDELLHLRTRLGEVEQEREKAQIDKLAVQQELEQTREAIEQARADANVFGAHTLVQEDAQAAIERLEAENERLRNQPDGDSVRRDWLKPECRDMAAYLRWFLKDHEHETDDEIVDLYRERYLDKVSVLLQQLERQDLYPPEDRKGFQIAADKFPRSPMAIRNLAGTLGSIGQEI